MKGDLRVLRDHWINIIARHLFKGHYEKWQMLILTHLETTNQGLKSQWVKVLLSSQEKKEYQLGNQNMNKKHHSKEGELKKEGSPILMLTVCTRSYLSIIAEPLMQPIMRTLDVKAGGFTSKAGMSHSPMRMLRIFGKLKSILGKNRIRDLGFDIPKGPTVQQAVVLNKVEEKLPSMSDIAKGDDIELQEITENASRIIENLNQQLEGESSEDLPMCELLGLDKQLRSIRGLLKVEVAKRFS